jgi:hypothetical protein
MCAVLPRLRLQTAAAQPAAAHSQQLHLRQQVWQVLLQLQQAQQQPQAR